MDEFVACVDGIVFGFEGYVEREVGLSFGKEKTVDGICKYYLKGRCIKGRNCKYLHLDSVSDAAKYNMLKREKGVVCKHWLRGLCKKGDMCDFLHEYNLKKMPECYFFSKFGECSNGDECMYLHIDPNAKKEECLWYSIGFCRLGPECPNKHIRRAVCLRYLTGFCPLGAECELAHPRTVEDVKEESEAEQERNKRRLETVLCFKCKQYGHYANNCPKKQNI
ncbi:MAG: cleavage and polyadenylation specificity factor subunit 4 [Amphiamblys sp. WSBS2006]|nr:MAG: cleavage and polyadenylation specificity factor subunit 4 [Amphiamblys sp. WSBS2006]